MHRYFGCTCFVEWNIVICSVVLLLCLCLLTLLFDDFVCFFFNIMQKRTTSKPVNTTVVLSWNAAKDDNYKEKWEYGVYYGLNAAELLSGMLLVGQLLCLTEVCYLK
jgi:hypothetical protein